MTVNDGHGRCNPSRKGHQPHIWLIWRVSAQIINCAGDHVTLEKSVIIIRGCFKKTLLKEMNDFLTLKMLPLALALIKRKNCHLFDTFVTHALFNGKFSLAIRNSKFSCKMGIFWPMGQKDGDILFWSTPEPMVTILAFKNHKCP